jgi:LPXTG-site transpeptidase (sortase) family protein
LLIVGGLFLGLVLNLLIFSPMRHDRDQHVAYADFRSQLANAIAPTGITTTDGALLAMGAPVAWIDAPGLGIDEVVLNGTTSTVLMSGPGHQRDTAMPGQVGHAIVMGRAWAFGGPFKSLSAATVGTQFSVSTGQGTFDYEVTAVRANGEDPVALQPGEGRLTLVSASGAPYLPTGLVQVDARLMSDAMSATSPVLPSLMLTGGEAPLVGDSSAAVGLLLWSVLLLGAALTLVWLSVRWGRWQTWIVAVPVFVALGVAVTNHIVMLLPNLL